MNKKVLSAVWTLMLLGGSFSLAYGLSSMLSTFNTTYGTSGTALSTCSLCHPGGNTSQLNDYANDFLNAGANAAALAAIANLDSDGDNFSNIAEITARTFPGDATSHPSTADTTLPTVTSFTIPPTATSLIVPITAFTATDNVGVTGYLLTQTSSKPVATATGWTATAPTSYTFSAAGSKTLYAWAKDAAGNVSNSMLDTAILTVNTTQILWRNSSTGQNAIWTMDGVNLISSQPLPTQGNTNWKMVGRGDFNYDGKTDILWRNTATGENAYWYMDGTTVLAGAVLHTVADLTWTIVGTGDFNGDGKTDILWRNTANGHNVVWYMNGTTIAGSASLMTQADQNWKIVGTGDFNGDGKPDIVWRNSANGQNAIWYVNGTAVNGQVLPTEADLNWTIVGTGDFNNDTKPDILWRATAGTNAGQNRVWYMDGLATRDCGAPYSPGYELEDCRILADIGLAFPCSNSVELKAELL